MTKHPLKLKSHPPKKLDSSRKPNMEPTLGFESSVIVEFIHYKNLDIYKEPPLGTSSRFREILHISDSKQNKLAAFQKTTTWNQLSVPRTPSYFRFYTKSFYTKHPLKLKSQPLKKLDSSRRCRPGRPVTYPPELSDVPLFAIG